MCTQLLTVALLVAVAVPLHAQEDRPPLATALRVLQVSFVGLQAADLHSTFRAVDNGTSTEVNPLMVNRGSAVALKACVSVAMWAATYEWAKKHPKAARITLAAMNGAYAALVVNNYRVGSR
jgi:hypothetical protein